MFKIDVLKTLWNIDWFHKAFICPLMVHFTYYFIDVIQTNIFLLPLKWFNCWLICSMHLISISSLSTLLASPGYHNVLNRPKYKCRKDFDNLINFYLKRMALRNWIQNKFNWWYFLSKFGSNSKCIYIIELDRVKK